MLQQLLLTLQMATTLNHLIMLATAVHMSHILAHLGYLEAAVY